jgi:hypothetical protein
MDSGVARREFAFGEALVLGPGGDIIIARCLTLVPIKPLARQTAGVMHKHDPILLEQHGLA